MTTVETPQPPATSSGNGYGVAALVLGIVAVVAGVNGWWILPLPIALATGVLAIVFGVLGRRRARAGEAVLPSRRPADAISTKRCARGRELRRSEARRRARPREAG